MNPQLDAHQPRGLGRLEQPAARGRRRRGGRKLYGRSSCGSMRQPYNLPMSILKVARMGHPVLRQRARPLDKADLRNPLIQKLIDDMIETMHEYHGVGLAAPQIHEGVRLFVALLDDDPDPTATPWRSSTPRSCRRAPKQRRVGKAASASPTSAAWCRATPTSSSARSIATGGRSSCRLKNFRGARRAARDGSPGRRPVFRPDDVDGSR